MTSDYKKQKLGKAFPGNIGRDLITKMMEKPRKPIKVFSWHYISISAAAVYRKEKNRQRNKRFRRESKAELRNL